MSPNEKDTKIIELLNAGKSYTAIQEILQVSPSKISAVKRSYLPENSENSTPSSATSSESSSKSSSEDSSTIFNENAIFNGKINKKEPNNAQTDNKNNNNNSIINKIMENLNIPNYFNSELEQLKQNQAHEIELKKIELQREVLEQQNRESYLQKSRIDIEAKKIERQAKSLIYQFRKIMKKYQNGRWSYQLLCDHRKELVELLDQIEEFCFKESMDTENLTILNILNRTIQEFKSYAEEIFVEDPDQCDECDGDCEGCGNNEEEYLNNILKITIDSETQKMIHESQAIDFDDFD